MSDKKTFYVENNDISDGYHTFKELYDYRMLYNALWVNELHRSGQSDNYKLHKSFFHHDGELCFDGGWFIVSVTFPNGQQISNHYEECYWDLFKIPECNKSYTVYDGHTPETARCRMEHFLTTYKFK